jgi:hypothetical protein
MNNNCVFLGDCKEASSVYNQTLSYVQLKAVWTRCLCQTASLGSNSSGPNYSFGPNYLVLYMQLDTVTGDSIFVLQQQEHCRFKRKV